MAYLPIDCSKIANGPRKGVPFKSLGTPRKHNQGRCSPTRSSSKKIGHNVISEKWMCKIKSEGSLSPRRFENHSNECEDTHGAQIAALEQRIQALTNQVELF